MKFGTRILHTGNEIEQTTGAVSIPVYHASTFKQNKVDEFGPYEYARSGNPTRDALEAIIAKLEGGVRGFAFSSGIAAISSVLLLFSPGDHIVVCEDVYGGTYRVLTGLFNRLGIEVTFVDFTDPAKVKTALRRNTKGVYAETPSNPLLKITDLRAVSAIARENGLLSMVDNTFLTPYLQRPIELGIDIVIHSATKYLGGHSDLLAGLVVAADKQTAERINYIQYSFGAVLGPQDCWLLMRGIKTLKARMDMHQSGARKLAEWLAGCPEVKEVYFPGLPDHPGKEIHDSQADGPGGIVSFRMQTEEMAKRLLENVKLSALAVSLGAVESIISYPVTMSHAGMHPDHRVRTGVTGDLIRLSVGLEDPGDLIEDLAAAIS
ncbi:MAG: Cystathionine beta-lyase MetC [Pelotomaculum sp. PtaB.Bin013]|uniref:cysteine-S-conjugate beta-lyase n=1 Tax=Pelotomaculum isophthalicicum JI TaxID=947010 RepID=A0A9X4JTN0_9FIRM|nr:aminotransferase class I/II-fold pyridoxal phosphate-dependent enzyme [Pelotomaculum isophthalicicum]MDF9407660.1 aminotransferase class I/II-fold pyridoxal phosphate-dependent enzyme [Pelotomaculum isophthalicicum JI]OPX84089.1 MAG: Cystathionine beta-lyase MetC [Pelotomaculum sp. PtaB.Bin013]